MLTFIWAEDRCHHIGYRGTLPWHLPDDLAYFRDKTYGHFLIMGKKTFDSLPQLLPNRFHVVLTHVDLAPDPQCLAVHSIKALKDWVHAHSQDQIDVIGGLSVFKALQSQVTLLLKTEIEACFLADTKMLPLPDESFIQVSRIKGKVDSQNPYPHNFVVYQRLAKN